MNDSCRWPVIVDARASTEWMPGSSLVQRHSSYGEMYAASCGDNSRVLTILQVSKLAHRPTVATIAPHLRVVKISLLSLLRFKVRSVLGLPAGTRISWIFSEPFTPALLRFVRFRQPNDRVQVQAHGDFGSPAFSFSGARGLLRAKLATRSYRYADSVRAVGERQALNLMHRFLIRPEKLFISPVPIDPLFLEPSHGVIQRFPRVLFVGRFHSERGLDLWGKTAEIVARQNPEVTCGIAGVGPEERRFRVILSAIDPRRVFWFGSLGAAALRSLFEESSVLLSTPPTEAFGRAMVEALACGLRIVATPTSGALDLADFPGIFIASTPEQLADGVRKYLLSEPDSDMRDHFQKVQLLRRRSHMEALIRSWL